jgi:hypothetical protein
MALLLFIQVFFFLPVSLMVVATWTNADAAFPLPSHLIWRCLWLLNLWCPRRLVAAPGGNFGKPWRRAVAATFIPWIEFLLVFNMAQA